MQHVDLFDCLSLTCRYAPDYTLFLIKPRLLSCIWSKFFLATLLLGSHLFGRRLKLCRQNLSNLSEGRQSPPLPPSPLVQYIWTARGNSRHSPLFINQDTGEIPPGVGWFPAPTSTCDYLCKVGLS